MMNLLEEEIAGIVLQNSPIGVMGFDPNLKCNYWNPAMEEIFGFRPEEVLGRQLEDFLHYLKNTEEINYYKRTLHGISSILEKQFFIIPEKGKEGFYSAKFQPIYRNLEVIGGTVMIQETSKLSSALESLESAEKNYSSLVKYSPLPVVVFTEEEVLLANAKTLELLGLENENEILGKSPLMFVVEKERGKAGKNIREILGEKIIEPVMHKLLTANGTEVDAEITYITTTFSEKPAVQIVIRDISQYKKAYQELYSNKEMLHEAQKMAKMGSYRLGVPDKKLFWTRGVYNILEVEPSGFTPCLGDYYSFVEKAVQVEIESLLNKLCSKEISNVSYLHKIISRGGKEKWIKLLARPKLNEKNEVESIVGTIQDITELRKVEEELHRANQILSLHFENSPLATIQLDSDLVLTSWSKQARNIFGWSANEVIGKHITSWKFLNEECKNIFMEFNQSGKRNYFHLKKGNMKFFTQHNTFLYCDMFVSGISGEDGKLHSVLVLLNDVTSRQISEQTKLDVQLEERKRVAREIHDGIGQMLIAVKYKMASLEEFVPEEFQYKIQTLEGMLEQTLEEVRSVSRNLAPRSVGTMGLESSLRQMCDQIKKMTAIDLSFRYIGSGVEVNNKIVNALFRIAQEATNNIVKHAMASVASIQVFQGRNFIELKIDDNGKGIKNYLSANGMGMKNMEERAKLLNGRFQVHSEAGAGTNIIVNIPLEQTEV